MDCLSLDLVPAKRKLVTTTTTIQVAKVAATEGATFQITGSRDARYSFWSQRRSHLHATFSEWKILLEDRLHSDDRPLSSRAIFSFENNAECIGNAQELFEAINCRPELDALVVYGSRARSLSDCLSDWDLLVVSSNSRHALEHRRIKNGAISFDLTYGGLPALAQQIAQRCSDNNNWLLNACMEARPVSKLSGLAEVLLRRAEILYSKGPEPLTAYELARVRGELVSRLRSIAPSRERARASIQKRLVYRVKLDQLAIRLVYITYVLARKWTTSINPLLIQCEADYPELFAALADYGSSFEEEQGRERLQAIASSLINDIDSRLIKGDRYATVS